MIDTDGGLLPANILGDMWGRFWTGLFKFVIPYPDAPSVDVTDELVAQGQGFLDNKDKSRSGKLATDPGTSKSVGKSPKGYDATKLFELSDDFFDSLGMMRMNDGFWKNSVIERPDGIEMICHPTAWDMGNGEDFRYRFI